ncbi:uncharacterized protein FOMMEDRAFT_165832 [Fomitiporia mediterranea MF3/22]|uniref:uncharacterized protein n=1 Tax=Fomitiporia mediterranea (strain MF3/22) TaxID=694068 RepID=UPI0004407486|nr:uncharacterized protein FOMMEDRAFT_165832 [Fomitiporia mediterranea MF3/22]EJD05390.1 hypothetical protein FOMMEDRAFT_165832 [Fomitiporia mediterranea MF3/22]
MADSFTDIEGPITAVAKFIAKPEHVDEFATWLLAYAERAKVADGTYCLSVEIVRHENLFMSWEKFSGPEAVMCTYAEHAKSQELVNKWLADLPELKFFATNSVAKSS